MARMKHFLLVLLAVLILAQPFKVTKPVLGSEDDYEDDEFDAGDLEETDEPEAIGPEDDGEEDDGSDLDYAPEEGVNEQDATYDDEEEEDAPPAPLDEDDGDVVTLTQRNFQSTLTSAKYVMVEFYAPWCGHCQALVPEYKKAAEILKTENVVLAKVDGTRETKLAEHYGVEGFPTIFFFVDGKPMPYKGGRTSEEIVSWVKKKMGPPVETLSETTAAEKVLVEQSVISAAYFEKLEGPEFEAYQLAARDDDIYFVQTTNLEIAKMFNLSATTKQPALALLKDKEEIYVPFDGSYEFVELTKFFTAHKLPLVITFTEETSSKIFGSDIKKQLLLFVDEGGYAEAQAPFIAAAREFRELIFVHINVSDKENTAGILEYFSVDGSKPAIYIRAYDHSNNYDDWDAASVPARGCATALMISEGAPLILQGVMGFESEDDGRKYKMDKPITEENVKAFASDFLNGKAKPFLKSDPPPEKNDGPVTVVVGSTFDEIVLDETKDVLLEVYAPWCGHCKKLTPIYEKLGKRFSSVDSVVIAKIDGTSNEHLQLKVDGFPTLLFYPAGNKVDVEPLKVEGERTLKPLTKFIKKHAVIPFTLPKKGQLHLKSAEEIGEEQELEQAGDEEAIPGDVAKDEL